MKKVKREEEKKKNKKKKNNKKMMKKEKRRRKISVDGGICWGKEGVREGDQKGDRSLLYCTIPHFALWYFST